MLFNSIEFLFFLPTVFILYWFVFGRSWRWQNLLILVASYFFYGWWSWKFLGLLILSTVLDYIYGFSVASTNRRRAKTFLWLSVINNLGILAVFKYYNFFAVQFQEVFALFGLRTNPVLLNVLLPVGISFYTFHGMSYVFDIYRGKQKPVSNYVNYAVFVAFFPLLVAGPIERANHLLPQIQQRRTFRYAQMIEGCKLILWGFVKKVLIADSLAVIVDDIFLHYTNANGATLAMGAIAFSFQIYGDFSGYSDIALGTAKLFGFELLSNFRFPYFSRDIAEFWRRWHISLSSWFRDYLYIPLGGSKQGKAKAVRNTFIIFLVSGFWHGASWNFIVWGAIHACGFLPLLLLNRNRKFVAEVVAQNRSLPSMKELMQMITTFGFVTFAWIFFRADNLSIAVDYISNSFQSLLHDPKQIVSGLGGKSAIIYIIPLILVEWWFRRDERNPKLLKWKYINWIIIIILSLIIFNVILGYLDTKPSSFIYFEF